MLNRIFEKIKDFIKKYTLTFVIFCVVSFLCLISFWIWLERATCADEIKLEIKRFQASLNSSGYDLAYDNLTVNRFSFSKAITFTNLKIYKLTTPNYLEWNIPELVISPGLFCNKVNLKFSSEQSFKTDDKTFKILASIPRLSLEFQKSGLTKVEASVKDITIENLAHIDSIGFAAERMAPQQINELTPFFENHLDIIGIQIADNVDSKAPKKIEKIYINANIIGIMKSEPTYDKSVVAWQKLGGMIDIKKMILHAEPLNMVAKGDLYFNDRFAPTIQLNTSSKGMIEFLDIMNEAEILDSKGVFVVKILLNNKGFYLNEGDDYKTVTSSLSINKKEMTLENIAIKSFVPQEK